MDEEKAGLSIGEIFKIIFSYKWLAVAIALTIAVIGTLALYFGYDVNSKNYSCTFSLVFPGNGSTDSRYPDNMPFDYRDIISRQNLTDVKNLDENFAGINVEQMFNKNAISVSRFELENSSAEHVYNLKVSAKYFDNQGQAENFIYAVAETPLRYIMSLTANKDVFLQTYDKSDFYEDKTKSLTEQVNYLSECISELVTETGGTLRVDCQLLANRLESFSQDLNMAIAEMREKLYVHNAAEVRENYSLLITSLENQRTFKLRELEILFGKLQTEDDKTNIDQISPRVETLASEVAEIEEKIAAYGKYVAPDAALQEKPELFEQALAKLYSRLKEITDDYERNLESYYSMYSLVVYDGAVKTESALGIAMCIVISVIGGIIIAAIAAFVVGYIKLKKRAGCALENPEGSDPQQPANN